MNNYDDLKIKLEVKKEELRDRLNRIRQSKRKEHDKDWAEQASERENDDVVDILGENIMKELEQIDNSLKRMERNEYNICASCGEDINDDRLFALPYTSLCIKCAGKI